VTGSHVSRGWSRYVVSATGYDYWTRQIPPGCQNRLCMACRIMGRARVGSWREPRHVQRSATWLGLANYRIWASTLHCLRPARVLPGMGIGPAAGTAWRGGKGKTSTTAAVSPFGDITGSAT